MAKRILPSNLVLQPFRIWECVKMMRSFLYGDGTVILEAGGRIRPHLEPGLKVAVQEGIYRYQNRDTQREGVDFGDRGFSYMVHSDDLAPPDSPQDFLCAGGRFHLRLNNSKTPFLYTRMFLEIQDINPFIRPIPPAEADAITSHFQGTRSWFEESLRDRAGNNSYEFYMRQAHEFNMASVRGETASRTGVFMKSGGPYPLYRAKVIVPNPELLAIASDQNLTSVRPTPYASLVGGGEEDLAFNDGFALPI